MGSDWFVLDSVFMPVPSLVAHTEMLGVAD